MNPLLNQLETLTAQKITDSLTAHVPTDNQTVFAGGGLSHSQLNELLLSFGYDRISKGFFNYFFLLPKNREPSRDYDADTPYRISTPEDFESGIEKFQRLAMLKFGNFKYAFKYFRDKEFGYISRALEEYEEVPEEVYTIRPDPIADLQGIDRGNTPLLGYIVGGPVKELKEKKAKGVHLTTEEESIVRSRDDVIEKAIRNYETYLCFDYMDVYVATSMRRPEEFYDVYDFVRELFDHQDVKGLKLRYFDPTQADPQDRINKSLIEGLMVKRAKCTIYCAQESDTFGKDSELAATMAQGKPVIAYVPEIHDVTKHAKMLREVAAQSGNGNPRKYLEDMFVNRHARYVFENPSTLQSSVTEEHLSLEIAKRNKDLYDNRARTLKDIHPLALQVNLNTGVANGLLVVRNVPSCAEVLRGVILQTLKFTIEEWPEPERPGMVGFVLRESTTKSIFRVVTGDPLLSNSFWNFYPGEGE